MWELFGARIGMRAAVDRPGSAAARRGAVVAGPFAGTAAPCRQLAWSSADAILAAIGGDARVLLWRRPFPEPPRQHSLDPVDVMSSQKLGTSGVRPHSLPLLPDWAEQHLEHSSPTHARKRLGPGHDSGICSPTAYSSAARRDSRAVDWCHAHRARRRSGMLVRATRPQWVEFRGTARSCSVQRS